MSGRQELSPFDAYGEAARRVRRGLDAYVVPQGEDLPFCNTREDILIRRRDR